ncbi:TPA: hypothetical protein DCR49_07885 [Candidatus Delongbacteria bacterium]|nr:MAG: hypothetical protein A2Y39_04190 [Candidatus Delongbacteria bacterium GWF2_40_14]HAQ61901.1 hypothetical protein [Candidatus Delongbacteria bacterium]
MLYELQYPGFLLAAALAVAYLSVMFYLGKEQLSKKSRSVLFILKYVFVSMTVIIIFDPEIIKSVSEEKPERHLILFDNSRSMTLSDPTDTVVVKSFLSKVTGEDSFIICSFGESTEILSSSDNLDFSDDFTNISGKKTNSLIEDMISAKNIKSIAVITDGNFSDADNFSLKYNVPVNIIYSSPAADRPDVFIQELIYQDNPGGESKFIVVAGYKGSPLSGKFDIKLMEKGRVIKSLSHNIPEPGTFATVRTDLPEISGTFRETEFVIEPLKKEKNLYNNRKTAYQKKSAPSDNILILANSPSLDLAFLTRLLKSGGYNFKVVYENALNDSLKYGGYASLISVGTPARNTTSATEEFISGFAAKMFFLNRSTDLARLNRITNAGITNYRYVPTEGRITENSEGAGGFLLARSSVPVILKDLPETIYNSALFVNEKVFIPLMLVSGSTASKAVYHSSKAEKNTILVNLSSFWKAAFNDENENFSKLILNLADLLSADRSLDRIKILPSKVEYYSGEKIVLKGMILDEKLEPAQNAQAEVTVSENSLNTKFTYSNKEYSAEMLITQPGQYNAVITVKSGAGSTKRKVRFRVIENDLETQSIGADTLFLKNFASARGGIIVPLNKADNFFSGMKGKKETVTKTVRISLTRNIYYFILLALVFLIELAYRKFKDLS